MKLQTLHEARYAGPKNFNNLLQHFTEERRTEPERGYYVPRDEVTIKNIVDEFYSEGEEQVRMLIVFHDTNRVRIFYRDSDQTVSFAEAVDRLAVFALKRVF